jgi:gliotoxin/aspirochlorine biosynthesis thioredoxin reductase
MSLLDVAIIGAGPAGLTAAGTLLRQLHTVVLFDSGIYRNAKASHMHMVPTWDHKSPSDFRSKAREDLARYSTLQIVNEKVIEITKRNDSSFELWDQNGTSWTAQKIILAIGSVDIFPVIEGYAESWGKRM